MSNQPLEQATAEHRRSKRHRVLKRGKISFGFGGSTIDCLIIDESGYGVMVETGVPMPVPEQLTIMIDGRAMFPAIRRWAMGNRLGLEFIGPQIHDRVTVERLRVIDNVLEREGLTQALNLLRAAQFYDDKKIRSAAEAAETAVKQLQTLLREDRTTPSA